MHEDGDAMHGELLDCAMQERATAGLRMRKRTVGEDVMVGRKRKPPRIEEKLGGMAMSGASWRCSLAMVTG